MRRTLITLIAAIFAWPFAALWWTSGAPSLRAEALSQVLSISVFSIAQAAASAACSLAFGVLAASGIFWAGTRSRILARAVRWAALMPSAAPPVATVLTWMRLFPGVRGFGAVVGAHALIASGLVAIAIERAVRAKISGAAELALVEGCGRAQFWLRAVLPTLRGDAATIALFVFAACFSSLAVPLTLGGPSAATLDVLVSQRAMMSNDWSGALGVGIIQILFILAASALIPSAAQTQAARPARLDLVAWAPGAAFAVLPAILLAGALTPSAWRGALALRDDALLRSGIGRMAAASFCASVFAALACIAILLALACARPCPFARRALVGYATPSAALIGLALLATFPGGAGWGLTKIALGSALLIAPALYRLQWDSLTQGLSGQVAAAQCCGASGLTIFSRVLLPTLWRPACALGGLAALWTWGEFAMSSIASEKRLTLAQAAAGLLDSYRMDAAAALIVLAMVGGAITYLLVAGAGYVDRS